jgi:hypothetical protein
MMNPKNRFLKVSVIIFIYLSLASCGYYNFTGTGKIDAKTFQVNYFRNTAEIVQPGIERDFTIALQDLIQNQTNLNLTNRDADLLYEGEITDFRIAPMTATANQKAAQNRLSITVNVRFMNKKKSEDDFEKKFTFFYDYPATDQLIGSKLTTATTEIFSRITQDVFNESLAKW